MSILIYFLIRCGTILNKNIQRKGYNFVAEYSAKSMKGCIFYNIHPFLKFDIILNKIYIIILSRENETYLKK
jgi:hypothetical protein